jgi:glutathione synthase/RimK-type ligase-like ATP-grasp enzyme
MKIAIHNRPGSFSDKWILYCKIHQIGYKVVNCFDTNIISQLNDCDGLMWHWAQWDSKAILFARQLAHSLEHIGKKVFPNMNTCWHFDDRVGQKYLLESLDAPLVKSYVFYDKNEALKWANTSSYPKVFKLRGGAGSVNVKLVRNKKQCQKLINTAFGKGFRVTDKKNGIKDRFIKLRRDKNPDAFIHVLKGFGRLVFPKYDERMRGRDKGYIYFQDYITNNNYDIRVIIIGERAFAIKRIVRKNDFRASGSGNIIYKKKEIPITCIKSAFKWAVKLDTQNVAFDFVFDNEKIMLVEISYAFSQESYLSCPGFWDKQLNWHRSKFIPEFFMIEDFLYALK